MTRVQRTRTALLLNIGLALALTGGVDRKAAVRNRDANQAFGQQQFEAAADLYNEALTEAPDAPGISYNLGNAFYRQQQYEDAASALARGAQSDDPAVRHRSLYNLGNTFFNMGQLPEAIEAYRKALEIHPDDLDTKINYEKALLMQQQQEQEQQQQQQEQQNQDSEQQDQNSESQQGEDGEQQQEQQQNDSQENQDSPQEQGNDEQQGESEEEQEQPGEEQQPQEAGIDSVSVPEGEMRPEEALRILEAMRDQEKELQKEKARKARARARRVEKDW